MIGIIGAMEEEIKRFLEEMEETQQKVVYQMSFYLGKLHGRDVVICKSGVGKVNAALCTQTLVEHFQVKTIFFTGVAGALHPDLDIGDIVISTECQQHDLDVTALGFERGVIPFQEVSIFPADPKLVQLAVEAAKQTTEAKVMTGKILSGDQFISDPQKGRQLYEEFGGICVEMEGAAVAHACHVLGVPFVVIRSMSDRADHSANVNFMEFTQLAADRSCAIVSYMVKHMGKI